MRIIETTFKIIALATMAFCLQISLPATSFAQDIIINKQVEPRKDPPFRTELGLQLSLGANTCLKSGSEYATCKGPDHSWDTSVGTAIGLLTRPFKNVSFGLDVMLGTLRYHQYSKSKWSDFQIGPSVRYHHPLYIKKLYFEPIIGITGGFVRGDYNQRQSLGTTASKKFDLHHIHTGVFATLLLGMDFFPIPKLGIGIDVRLTRTVYTEVCFESSLATACRGLNDESVAERWTLQGIPGDLGNASFPWKLFLGLHSLYYF